MLGVILRQQQWPPVVSAVLPRIRRVDVADEADEADEADDDDDDDDDAAEDDVCRYALRNLNFFVRPEVAYFS